MTVTPPAPTRYTIESEGDSCRLIIPSRKIWYVIATTGFGVAVWVAGSIILAIFLPSVLNSLLRPANVEEVGLLHIIITVVMLGTVVFWIFLGIFIGRMFLWHVAGKEIIGVTSRSLTLSRRMFNLGRNRVYPVERIKNLRLESPSVAPDLPGTTTDFYGISLTIDWLAFEYEAKTIWFARGLDEAEARQLLGTIRKYLLGE